MHNTTLLKVKFKKVCFDIAQYSVRWPSQSVLHFTPWQTCSFQHHLDFSGKHSSHAAIMCEDYSLTCANINSQVLIYTAEWTGATMEIMKMSKLWNGSKGNSNPGSLDCESGILPLNYRAPHKIVPYILVYTRVQFLYTGWVHTRNKMLKIQWCTVFTTLCR